MNEFQAFLFLEYTFKYIPATTSRPENKYLVLKETNVIWFAIVGPLFNQSYSTVNGLANQMNERQIVINFRSVVTLN